MIYLDGNIKKLKGNLNTHSLRSDGENEVCDVINIYKKHGYDFMVLSDYDIYFNTDEFDTKKFLVLPGMEKSSDIVKKDEISYENCIHLQAIRDKSIKTRMSYKHNEDVTREQKVYKSIASIQKNINELKLRGQMVIVNHPGFTRIYAEDLVKLDGYTAVEIYNEVSFSGKFGNPGTSDEDIWEYLLEHGKRVWGVATDDLHEEYDHSYEIKPWCQGYIGVEASLNKQDIINKIKEGKFFASNGPRIYDYRIEDNIVKIECDDVKYISFITYENLGKTVYNKDGRLLNRAEYKLTGKEKFIRVKVIDSKGKCAWTQPIFFD